MRAPRAVLRRCDERVFCVFSRRVLRVFLLMALPFSSKKITSQAYLLAPCALLALGAFARELPPPKPLSPQVIRFGGAAARRDALLMLSQTMVVKAQKSAGSTLLKSRLEAAGITARAPLAGQIARVLVREGQSVNVNDRVLQISARGENLVDPGAQRAQTRAESAQVAAAQDQTSLQNRMGSAHERLAQAQQRVARARTRVLAAQQIVEGLKNGTPVEPEAPRENPTTRQANPAANEARREVARAENAAAKAAAQAEKSAAAATAAKNAAGAAQDAAREAQRDAEKAAKTVAPKRSNDGDGAAKNSATPSEGAAKSKSEAPSESGSGNAAAAARVAETARKKADRLQDEARTAQRQAQRDQETASAARRAKNTLNVPLFGDSGDIKKPVETPASTRERNRNVPRVSVADAARLVQSAQEESAAAIAQARKLKSEVDRYDNQVTDTQQRMDSSGKKMEAAQQRLMDSTIRASLSVVRAPTSGTVLWVAPLASEVESGQPLITVGNRRRLRVDFEDKSGAWKTLRAGATLTALAYPASADGTAPMKNGASITLKVDEIEAPRRAGEAAKITGSVDSKATGSVKLQNGMLIVCSLDVPGTRSVMMVPSSAIRRGENGDEIAVLQPQQESSASSESASTRDGDAAQGELYRVEWRRVVTGKDDGVRHEVKSGIAPGERIVLQPETLGADAAPALVRLARS